MRRKPPPTGTTPNMREPRPAIRRVAVLGAELALLLLAVVFCLGSARPAAAVPRDTGTPNTATTLVLQGAAKEEVGALEAEAARVQAEIDALDHQVERLTEKYNEFARLDQINAQLLDAPAARGGAQTACRRAISRVVAIKSGREASSLSWPPRIRIRDRLVLMQDRPARPTARRWMHEAGELAAIEAAIRGKSDELELRAYSSSNALKWRRHSGTPEALAGTLLHRCRDRRRETAARGDGDWADSPLPATYAYGPLLESLMPFSIS